MPYLSGSGSWLASPLVPVPGLGLGLELEEGEEEGEKEEEEGEEEGGLCLGSSQSSPTATSGMLRKLTVPSSKASSSRSLSWCHFTPTVAALTVPPANQGRRSLARADRLTIRLPTPVG